MRLGFILSLAVCIPFIPATAAAQGPEGRRAVLVIHGGAGTILRAEMSAEREKEYVAALQQALRTGHAILEAGGSSLDAVEATVRVMEDSPLFNAGKGAVFTRQGTIELDASIMDGATRRAGAVTNVTILKNPIVAARAVMEKTPHVMMSGRGAEVFAAQHGIEAVDPSYFWTERRWKALQDELAKPSEFAPRSGMAAPPDSAPETSPAPPRSTVRVLPPPTGSSDINEGLGTVGAVALDRHGNLAAATSTGGRTGKLFGRVSDTSIIGAGNYADNASCAVSGTGHGEVFIRFTVAKEIAALVQHAGLPVAQAARRVVDQLRAAGADAGVIALDAKGNFALPFNTKGMYRGWVGEDGVAKVEIYGE